MDATVVEDSPTDPRLLFYGAAGTGVTAGLLAAGSAHLLYGEPVYLVMLFLYGISLYRRRGWKEYCAMMAMIGTVFAYFTVVAIVRKDWGVLLTLILGFGVVLLLLAYIAVAVARTAELRARALSKRYKIPTSEAAAMRVDDNEHWLEIAFAKMRAWRTAGDWWGYVRILAGPAVALIGCFILMWLVENIMIDALLSGVALYQSVRFARLVTYSRRLGQSTVDEVLAADDRQPILLLRPFRLDELPVDHVDAGWRGTFDMFSVDQKTFEQRIIEIFGDLGPIIAIGRPGEEAAPLGAAREYAEDAAWQQRVLDRARASQLVLMVLDETPGLEWEIDAMARVIGLQHIVILLPPGEDVFEERSPEWYQRWALLQTRFPFLPELPTDAAGVLFDDSHRPVVVTSGVSSVQKRLGVVKDAWVDMAGFG